MRNRIIKLATQIKEMERLAGDVFDINEFKKRKKKDIPSSESSRKVHPKIAQELYDLISENHTALTETLPRVADKMWSVTRLVEGFPKGNKIKQLMGYITERAQNVFGLTEDKYDFIERWLDVFKEMVDRYITKFAGMFGRVKKITTEQEQDINTLLPFVDGWEQFRNKYGDKILE